MPLTHAGFIDLPPNDGPGGFDHAAVHHGRGLLYVAHTANDAVHVIDTRAAQLLRSIRGLKGVAGALVDEDVDLVFTSNRGEDTVAIVQPDAAAVLAKIEVGVRPNGLAFDSRHRILLAANVGDPNRPGTHTVTLVDVETRSVLADVAVAGRTRWTVFDPEQRVFFVNVADPPEIVVIDAERPNGVVRRLSVPDRGPHGLDLDVARRRLYCACDGGTLVSLNSTSGEVLGTLELSGPPDVIFLDRTLQHLYVAVGDPGVIDVVDTVHWRRLETVPTERGAHTLALDGSSHTIYAFLPETHRAATYHDRG